MPLTTQTTRYFALATLALLLAGAMARAAETFPPPGDRPTQARIGTAADASVRTDFRAPLEAVDRAAPAKQSVAPAGKSVPLASKRLPPAQGESSPKASGWSTLLSALGSLTVVLGLFLAVVWFLRRTGPKSMTVLPSEVFEVLGHAPLAARQQAQLVRCGGKLLLLSVTPGGAETLAEIAEPAEVERLVGLCQQARPNSATASFRSLFAQFAGDGRAEKTTSKREGRYGLARLGRTRTEVADA